MDATHLIKMGFGIWDLGWDLVGIWDGMGWDGIWH